ncbi:MAG: ATP-dependent RecD-like DNA helicase [Oscillospiraceae bacterium]|nr:ATP-dependent RecD-like DNA helicase [Oscillospiraceae bacterium]
MEQLRCVVERITYQNEQNGYTVLRCRAKGFQDPVTVVGTMPDTHVGAVLELGGNWRVDAKYGRQFAVEHFEETLPATVFGIEKYLGSGMIKGVGPRFAKRIVRQFGKDTLDVIEQNPERLLEVPGIGRTRVERIRKSWQEQREVKNIMLFLQGHNVSTAHATRIYKTYGDKSLAVVQENPYQLADDIWGIGFRTADTIAEKLGFARDRFDRLRSGILYTLNQLSNEGHCYATREMLLKAGAELLDTDADKLGAALDEMLFQDDVVTDGEAIYLPPFYYAETGTAKRLHTIATAPGRLQIAEDSQRVPQATGMRYDALQQQAITTAVHSKVFLLTGGPGTGKTTTTLGILRAFQEAGATILLAAPTGRAAKRLSEATGLEAKTIHRLLEMKPPAGYQRNEENPLEGDVLIVDECSMIDLLLMYHLLKAVPPHMALVLVGDVDQLPSVGAGNVLRDLIASDCFPVVRLTRIFRQAQASRIITNAHRINEGKLPDLSNGRGTDFFFMERSEPEQVVRTVAELVGLRLPRSYHAGPGDIQVLTPMQRGETGAANLNQVLQAAVNPGTDGLRRGGYLFRVRDKVMQVRNNYEKEVYNGDIGVVTAVDLEERTLDVRFDERLVRYDVTELDELMLAYATTIHKSQGSEYPIVVMPVLMSHYVMLQRNLLYTGVTRAKRALILVGTAKAIACAVQQVTVESRNTMLKARIVQSFAGKQSAAVPVCLEEQAHRAWLQRDLFARLGRSRFRSRFHLEDEERRYAEKLGADTLRSHAAELVAKRLAPADPANDGKQTPMRGHPVFVAQHATGTCCRSCLEKWHGIPKNRALTDAEQQYAVDVILRWIARELQSGKG